MNYQRIYNQIIERAKSENRQKGGEIYYEAHHIIPKCLGGEGKSSQWKTHPNIVLLTAREHFLCHWLLHEIYPNNEKLFYAFRMLSKMNSKKHKNRYIPSSRIFEYVRKKSSLFFKNRIFSENHRNKLSLANKGKKYSAERIEKMKIMMIGKFTGDKHHFYNKIRYDMIGDKNPAKRPEVRFKLSEKRKLRGATPHNKKKVQIIETGEVLDSINTACIYFNVKYKKMKIMLKEGIIVRLLIK